jgi:hypothetical protein
VSIRRRRAGEDGHTSTGRRVQLCIPKDQPQCTRANRVDCTPLRKCSQQKRSGPGSTRRRSAEQPPPIKTNRSKADVPSTEDPQQSDSGLQTSDQAGNRATGAIPPGAGMTSKEAYHGRRATKRKEARKKGGRRGRKGTQPSCAAAHEVRVPHPGPLLHSMHLPRNPQKPTRPSRTSGRPSPTTTRRAKHYARADSCRCAFPRTCHSAQESTT